MRVVKKLVEIEPEGKKDRIVKVIKNAIFLLLTIFTLLLACVGLYVWLCLILGIKTELLILLIALLISASSVSAYVLVRLGWVDVTDWKKKTLLWECCLSIATILIVVGASLHLSFATGMMTAPIILLTVLTIVYVSVSLYVIVKLDLDVGREPSAKYILLLFIVFLPFLIICDRSRFFKEEVPSGITILGLASTILLFFPLAGPVIVFVENPSALIEQPWEVMKYCLMFTGVGFPFYLLSAGMARKLKAAWIGAILLSASCACIAIYQLATSFTEFEQRNLALVMIAFGIPTTLYLVTSHVREFFE